MTWTDNAACAGMDPALFHATPKALATIAALHVCEACPVRSWCEKDVRTLTPRERWGVWGGKVWAGEEHPVPPRCTPAEIADMLAARERQAVHGGPALTRRQKTVAVIYGELRHAMRARGAAAAPRRAAS